jgi:hypothetical protein
MPYADPQARRDWENRFKAERLEAMHLLLGAQCVVCGATDNLEFHHKVPELKEFNFNQRWTKPWPQIVAELSKCELRLPTASQAGP